MENVLGFNNNNVIETNIIHRTYFNKNMKCPHIHTHIYIHIMDR